MLVCSSCGNGTECEDFAKGRECPVDVGGAGTGGGGLAGNGDNGGSGGDNAGGAGGGVPADLEATL